MTAAREPVDNVSTLTKREMGRAILSDLFVNRRRVPIAEAVEAAQAAGVSRRTLIRACGDLGVREIHNGPYGAFWEKEATS